MLQMESCFKTILKDYFDCNQAITLQADGPLRFQILKSAKDLETVWIYNIVLKMNGRVAV